jgi:sodium-coupled neutral amino acid transporter 11
MPSHLQHLSAVCLPQPAEVDQALTLFPDHNSLLIYGSLKKPTLDRFATVTHYSTGVSLVMCLAMGIAGFLSFGSKTQGNVLNNFPSDNILVNIARL